MKIMNLAEGIYYEILNKEGYIITPEKALAVELALNTKPVAGAFLRGGAGTGKSFLAEVLGKIFKREVFTYQCFPGTREDDLLVKMVPDENSKSGIALTDGVVMKAAKASMTREIFLMLDEWDKTRPSADSFLLDFLQSGRINFAGQSCTAKLENIIVLIALNEDRELSEPLLRRLPVINFEPLPASLVRQALNLSHPGNIYIDIAVNLYKKCLQAGMPKPATVQELRQLLDAIQSAGDKADWDSLVFQFITKTKENHILLKSAESAAFAADSAGGDDIPRLSPEAYEDGGGECVEENKTYLPRLPRLTEVKKMTSVAEEYEVISGVTITPDLENCGGIIPLTDNLYDACVGIAGCPSEDPHYIGAVARVVGNKIVLNRAISLMQDFSHFFDQEEVGEIVGELHGIAISDVMKLRNLGWKIVKYSTQEILAKHFGADLRWLASGLLEVVFKIETGTGSYAYKDVVKVCRTAFLRKIKKLRGTLPPWEGFETQGEYYKSIGIPLCWCSDWSPEYKIFNETSSGWKKFLSEYKEA